MTVEAEQAPGSAADRGEVSGVVVHVLLGLVRRLNGDVGVAQALALADDGRSFATLGNGPIYVLIRHFDVASLAMDATRNDSNRGQHQQGLPRILW